MEVSLVRDRRTGSARLVALAAGVSAGIVTVALLIISTSGGPGLNPWSVLTLVPGAAASGIAIVRPDRPGALVMCAVLLAVAFVAAVPSVGWLYVPSLVLALVALGLIRRHSR